MVVFFRFLSIFICALAFTVKPVRGQDQSGFISLDCGLDGNSSYTDEMTGLNYISDASVIETGTSESISSEFNLVNRQIQTVRSFPDGVRNCYNIELIKDTKYLIRVIFLYGNYDKLNKLPAFDIHLGPNKWETIRIVNATILSFREIIHIPKLNYIDVCLVKTGPWTPFISALEIRPLRNGSYTTMSGALSLYDRKDIGSITGQTVRFPDDVHDRFWVPQNFVKGKGINTAETIRTGTDFKFQPPSAVMKTANIPINESQPFEFYIETEDNSYQFYVYMHFAELVKPQANQSRQFNIFLDGNLWNGPVNPPYLSAVSVFSGSPLAQGKYVFSFFKVGRSTLPPIINAFEIYKVVDLSQKQTDQDDVDAIKKIKSTYVITSNWQGDPCAPKDYVWDGLKCDFQETSLVIVSLDLSSRGLKGTIASDIANLKSLRTLNLSNNNLTGPVPEFLSGLPLKSLDLAGNNLTGAIPAVLLDKWHRGLLSLSISGNPELCETVSCDTKKNNGKNVTVPVVASVAGFLVIVATLAVVLVWLKRRNRQVTSKIERETEAEIKREPLESRKRQFSYHEVEHITNNFQRVLGRGGFGKVYHGYLDDVEVAVKMLSSSSIQGYKEFQAEVKLLLRVHHKNLTSLVGYCDEPNNLAVIYEYMANGNLKDRLSEGNSRFISWEGRLQIALESAQGLEYLHNGCKPPIVHRDVKTTNILLNDKFQAKLADFGLSRVFPVEGDSHVSTTVAGTPGYLDPEYYVTNWLTEKSDVYGFGVVLLEIITSQPVLSRAREKAHIVQWVSSMVKNGDIQGVIDPRLRGEFDVNSAWKAVELAMACVSTTSADRPIMSQVVVDLNDSLAKEMARSRDPNGYQSKSFDEMMSVNIHTSLAPLAR